MVWNSICLCLPHCLGLSVCLCLCLWWMFVHRSILETVAPPFWPLWSPANYSSQGAMPRKTRPAPAPPLGIALPRARPHPSPAPSDWGLWAAAVWKSNQTGRLGSREKGYCEGVSFFSPSCTAVCALSSDSRRKLEKRAFHSGNWWRELPSFLLLFGHP